jgi:hypothetical protein
MKEGLQTEKIEGLQAGRTEGIKEVMTGGMIGEMMKEVIQGMIAGRKEELMMDLENLVQEKADLSIQIHIHERDDHIQRIRDLEGLMTEVLYHNNDPDMGIDLDPQDHLTPTGRGATRLLHLLHQGLNHLYCIERGEELQGDLQLPHLLEIGKYLI